MRQDEEQDGEGNKVRLQECMPVFGARVWWTVDPAAGPLTLSKMGLRIWMRAQEPTEFCLQEHPGWLGAGTQSQRGAGRIWVPLTSISSQISRWKTQGTWEALAKLRQREAAALVSAQERACARLSTLWIVALFLSCPKRLKHCSHRRRAGGHDKLQRGIRVRRRTLARVLTAPRRLSAAGTEPP